MSESPQQKILSAKSEIEVKCEESTDLASPQASLDSGLEPHTKALCSTISTEKIAYQFVYLPVPVHIYVEKPHYEQKNSKTVTDKKYRSTMSQNYKFIVMQGFGRWLLFLKTMNPKLYSHFWNIIKEYESSELNASSIESAILVYLKENFKGLKTAGKTTKKMSTKKDLVDTLFPSEGDSLQLSIIKAICMRMLHLFLSKKVFIDWVNTCSANTMNKIFLWLNLDIMREVFLSPHDQNINFYSFQTSKETTLNSIPFKDIFSHILTIFSIAARAILAPPLIK
jgi:hypothetical protein